MANILSLLFGNKSQRDLKEVKPILDKCLKAYDTVKNLSNDELRQKTIEFKNLIRQSVEEEEQQKRQIKEKLDTDFDMSVDDKQRYYEKIEDLDKKIYATTQDILNKILPEAFAVVKETAKRFFDNEEVEVTATDFDRKLATTKDAIRIEGDKAYYKNSWMAG